MCKKLQFLQKFYNQIIHYTRHEFDKVNTTFCSFHPYSAFREWILKTKRVQNYSKTGLKVNIIDFPKEFLWGWVYFENSTLNCNCSISIIYILKAWPVFLYVYLYVYLYICMCVLILKTKTTRIRGGLPPRNSSISKLWV